MKQPLIYIVEDNASFSKVIASVLEGEYDFKLFERPEPVLELIDRNARPEIVITDINISGMDGLQFIETLRAKRFDKPVIAISGFVTSTSLVRAFELGITDFLEKPFGVDRFSAALNRANRMNFLARTRPQLSEQADYLRRVSQELLRAFESRCEFAEHEFFKPRAARDKGAKSPKATQTYLDLIFESQRFQNRFEAGVEGLDSLLKAMNEVIGAVVAPFDSKNEKLLAGGERSEGATPPVLHKK